MWVEWTVKFDNDQLLSSQYSGLKDQGGHAAETVFLVFYSGPNATTANTTLIIDGEDFSTQTPIIQEQNKKYYTAAYSSGVYTPVISYAQVNYSVTPEDLKNSWGRIFVKSLELNPGFTYSSNSFGFNNNSKIEIMTDELDGVVRYSHLYAGHSINIISDSADIRYNISLDNFTDLVVGRLKIKKEAGIIKLFWEHQSPCWTQNYQFQTDIQSNPSGYKMSSVRLLKNP